MAALTLLDVPVDILSALPDYLANIEDYTNLSSTCRHLKQCMEHATPSAILHLAAAQSNTFFRPSPHFLVCATGSQLGKWARQSILNEAILQTRLEKGIDGLMELVLEHCGLTLQRIRELHLMRFSIINPVTNIIDQCVGQQWYAAEDFWNGGRSDAYTIDSDPPVTLFHLAIYGELFGPDFETVLNRDTTTRRLSLETRLEYIKYCLPDFATDLHNDWEKEVAEGRADPRRAVKRTGPYRNRDNVKNHNIAMTWVVKSSRWRPYWKAARQLAGPEFEEEFEDEWWGSDSTGADDWRQRMWENVMICQGLEGMGMIRPGLQDVWIGRMKEWRRKIAALDEEPAVVDVGRQSTLEYPFLLGDLRVCVSGYVGGT